MTDTQEKPVALPLDQLAAKHGHTVKISHAEDSPFDWQHRVAASIHGWDSHNYHYQADPVLLTDAQYLAAIDAAESGHEPHEHALPKPPSAEDLRARIDAEVKRQKDVNDKARAEKKRADDSAKLEEKKAVPK